MNQLFITVRTFLLMTILFSGVVGLNAQDADTTEKKNPYKKIALKFAPLPFGFGQMYGLTSEIPLSVEYKFRQHHSVQFTVAPVIPNFLYAFTTVFGYESDPYWFFGGRGTVAYRYYFKDNLEKPFRWYFGGEVSINGMRTGSRQDRYNPSRDFYTWRVESKSRGIINTYGVTGGFQLVKERRRHDVVFNVTASLAYSYAYFWRKYKWGNLEFPRNGGTYELMKKVPLWGIVHIEIGGLLY